jgi:HSP20 family protein
MNGVQGPRRWDPFHDLQREVGRLFESFEPLHNWRLQRHFPAINLYDAGDRYVLTAELPGMAAADIDLSITGEMLTLRGERKRSEGIADDCYRRQERQFGRWARTVTLPERIDGARVAAGFAHGILTVSLPKDEVAKPRQITVATTSAGPGPSSPGAPPP